MTQAAMAHLEAYLTQVRRDLGELSDAEAREVLQELRSHVLDRLAGDVSPAAVQAALAALGSPREVARINAALRGAAAGQDRRAAGRLRSLGRIASLGASGLLGLAVSLLGYGAAAGLLLAAAWKPFAPGRVGLWRLPDPADPHSYSFGHSEPAPGAVELLGWWIVPLGLAGGLAVGLLTWRFGLARLRTLASAVRGRERHAPV